MCVCGHQLMLVSLHFATPTAAKLTLITQRPKKSTSANRAFSALIDRPACAKRV